MSIYRGFAPRHLERSDLVGVLPIAAFAFVLLMPSAISTHHLLDDLLFAVHPIVCVGWWLENAKSRHHPRGGLMPYRPGSWHTLLGHCRCSCRLSVQIGATAGLDGDFVSSVADGLGITSDLALTLWLLYVASGIASVLAGVILARADRPIVSPLLAVVLWIPFVWAVLNTNYLFFVLGFVMAVGVAGFGISREGS